MQQRRMSHKNGGIGQWLMGKFANGSGNKRVEAYRPDSWEVVPNRQSTSDTYHKWNSEMPKYGVEEQEEEEGVMVTTTTEQGNNNRTIAVQDYRCPKPEKKMKAQPVKPKSSDYEPLYTGFKFFDYLAFGDLVHIIVIGGSGDGKTELARALVAARSQADEQLVVLDTDGSRRRWGIQNLYRIEDIARATKSLRGELDRRMHLINTDQAEDGQFWPRITIFSDEWPAIADKVGEDASEFFIEIARRGRKVNMRLVIFTQSTTVDALGLKGNSEALKNFTAVRLKSFAIPYINLKANAELKALVQKRPYKWLGVLTPGYEVGGAPFEYWNVTNQLSQLPVRPDCMYRLPPPPEEAQERWQRKRAEEAAQMAQAALERYRAVQPSVSNDGNDEVSVAVDNRPNAEVNRTPKREIASNSGSNGGSKVESQPNTALKAQPPIVANNQQPQPRPMPIVANGNVVSNSGGSNIPITGITAVIGNDGRMYYPSIGSDGVFRWLPVPMPMPVTDSSSVGSDNSRHGDNSSSATPVPATDKSDSEASKTEQVASEEGVKFTVETDPASYIKVMTWLIEDPSISIREVARRLYPGTNGTGDYFEVAKRIINYVKTLKLNA